MRVKPLVIFDVCNTLFDANTTFDFVEYVCRPQTGRRVLFALVTRRFSPFFWLLAIFHKLTDEDLARVLVLRLLQHESEAALRSMARNYVRQELLSKAIAPTHRLLRRHIDDGDDVMLMSSSVDIVVAEIASVLGVEWAASRLDFSPAGCSGRLAEDLTRGKFDAARRLIERYDERPRLLVYTDNQLDRPLVEAADAASVVIHGAAQKRRWVGVSCTFIDLSE